MNITSEYIERKALLKKARELAGGSFSTPLIISAIEDAPAADVVEVVRCKDCKHLRIINGKGLYAYCPKTECKFEPFEIDTRTHYCSFGVRKEGEEK